MPSITPYESYVLLYTLEKKEINRRERRIVVGRDWKHCITYHTKRLCASNPPTRHWTIAINKPHFPHRPQRRIEGTIHFLSTSFAVPSITPYELFVTSHESFSRPANTNFGKIHSCRIIDEIMCLAGLISLPWSHSEEGNSLTPRTNLTIFTAQSDRFKDPGHSTWLPFASSLIIFIYC